MMAAIIAGIQIACNVCAYLSNGRHPSLACIRYMGLFGPGGPRDITRSVRAHAKHDTPRRGGEVALVVSPVCGVAVHTVKTRIQALLLIWASKPSPERLATADVSHKFRSRITHPARERWRPSPEGR